MYSIRPKIIELVAVISLICLGVIFTWGVFPVSAQDGGKFEVLGRLFNDDPVDAVAASPQPISNLVLIFVNIMIAAIVVIGLISMVIGAYLYMTAGGSDDGVKKGKTWIMAALTGVFLALVAWVILNTINPNIFKEPELKLPMRIDMELYAMQRVDLLES